VTVALLWIATIGFYPLECGTGELRNEQVGRNKTEVSIRLSAVLVSYWTDNSKEVGGEQVSIRLSAVLESYVGVTILSVLFVVVSIRLSAVLVSYSGCS